MILKLIFLSLAFADSKTIPEDSFSRKYEKAVDIVMGTFLEIGPDPVEIKAFDRFDKKLIRKGKIKIEKSWKGQRIGTVEFYYVDGKKPPKSSIDAALTGWNMKNGQPALIFLREESGKKLAAFRFGMMVDSSEKNIRKTNGHRALEAVNWGISLEQAERISDENIYVKEE